jgi:hypothetical protein
MAKTTPDFVQVQLTAAGLKFAGNGPLKVSNGTRSLAFTPGQTTKVELSYEWRAWLNNVTRDGQPLFEIAPDAASAGTASATNAGSAATTPSTK